MNTSTQANHGWWSKQIKVWDTNPAWQRSSPAPEDFPTHTYDAESVTRVQDMDQPHAIAAGPATVNLPLNASQ